MGSVKVLLIRQCRNMSFDCNRSPCPMNSPMDCLNLFVRFDHILCICENTKNSSQHFRAGSTKIICSRRPDVVVLYEQRQPETIRKEFVTSREKRNLVFGANGCILFCSTSQQKSIIFWWKKNTWYIDAFALSGNGRPLTFLFAHTKICKAIFRAKQMDTWTPRMLREV